MNSTMPQLIFPHPVHGYYLTNPFAPAHGLLLVGASIIYHRFDRTLTRDALLVALKDFPNLTCPHRHPLHNQLN